MAELKLDTAQELNITLRYKNTLKFSAAVTNASDSSQYNFTGYTASFEIRRSASDETPFVTFNETSGVTLTTGNISIKKTLPTNLKPGRYLYTLTLTDVFSVSTTWFTGILIIN